MVAENLLYAGAQNPSASPVKEVAPPVRGGGEFAVGCFVFKKYNRAVFGLFNVPIRKCAVDECVNQCEFDKFRFSEVHISKFDGPFRNFRICCKNRHKNNVKNQKMLKIMSNMKS